MIHVYISTENNKNQLKYNYIKKKLKLIDAYINKKLNLFGVSKI